MVIDWYLLQDGVMLVLYSLTLFGLLVGVGIWLGTMLCQHKRGESEE